MEESPESTDQRSSGVTLRISRRVRPGRHAEFEHWLDGISQAASQAPGFVSINITRPRRGGRDYQAIVRFASEAELQRWEASEERTDWYAQIEDLTEDAQVANITGTGQERKLARALSPVSGFVQTSVSGISLLLIGTLLALIMANSPLADTYEHFWETTVSIGVGDSVLTESLRHWVNDGLMALFFFIVGLEIKREVLVGEMRIPRLAALPIAAAVGGVVVPALVFTVINLGGEGAAGWGIPMATDTAFSLGVLSLLAGRVRPLLLVFLTAFAIVDDILAVLVIAVFYTATISWWWVGIAALLVGVLVAANAAGFHRWPIFAFVGLAVWFAVYQSGIHATFAGVLVAMTVPARSWINPSEFLNRARSAIADFEAACFIAPSILSNEPQQRATQELERLCEDVETPMTHLQHRLNPWVAYGILPLFAFANAGIPIVAGFGEALTSQIAWGVMIGLVLGKPLGITLFAWIAVRTGIAILPRAITWTHLLGVASLGGIGFTISLFVAELAFESGPLANSARIGILIGSVVAGVAGYVILHRTLPAETPAPTPEAPAESPADSVPSGATAGS